MCAGHVLGDHAACHAAERARDVPCAFVPGTVPGTRPRGARPPRSPGPAARCRRPSPGRRPDPRDPADERRRAHGAPFGRGRRAAGLAPARAASRPVLRGGGSVLVADHDERRPDRDDLALRRRGSARPCPAPARGSRRSPCPSAPRRAGRPPRSPAPTSTSQRATSPSVRPSPRSGSRNSYAIGLFSWIAASWRSTAWTPRTPFTSCVTRRSTTALASASASRRSNPYSRPISSSMSSTASAAASSRSSSKPNASQASGVQAIGASRLGGVV